MKKETNKKTKLNDRQINVAYLRLSDLYNSANVSAYTPVEAAFNFGNRTEVNKLAKRVGLTAPSLGEMLRSTITGERLLPVEKIRRVNTILASRIKAEQKRREKVRASLQEALMKAQDELLFGELAPADIPVLVRNFKCFVETVKA